MVEQRRGFHPLLLWLTLLVSLLIFVSGQEPEDESEFTLSPGVTPPPALEGGPEFDEDGRPIFPDRQTPPPILLEVDRTMEEVCVYAEELVYRVISRGQNVSLQGENQACSTCLTDPVNDVLSIECSLDYCEECDSRANACGIRTIDFAFVLSAFQSHETPDPNTLIDIHECTQFTQGYSNTTICEVRNNRNEDCEFKVDGALCNLCAPDLCEDGSIGIGGDCTNLNGGVRFSTCPEAMRFVSINTPYFIFRSNAGMRFDTCFETVTNSLPLGPTNVTKKSALVLAVEEAIKADADSEGSSAKYVHEPIADEGMVASSDAAPIIARGGIFVFLGGMVALVPFAWI